MIVFESGHGVISESELIDILVRCESILDPERSHEIDLHEFGTKLSNYACFVVAREEKSQEIMGLVAFYDNDEKKELAFLSVVVILPAHQGLGIGKILISKMIDLLTSKGFLKIHLEVDCRNKRAVSFYESCMFQSISRKGLHGIIMERSI